MKRLTTLTIALCFILTLGYAQKKNVRSASSALSMGKLDKAKEAIDPAIENEETKEWAQTWWIYGQTYQGIHEDQTGLFKKLDETSALDKAFNAYKKTLEYDKVPNKKGKVKLKYTDDVIKKLRDDESNIMTIKVDYIQEGINHFNDSAYENAMKAFENSLEIDKITKLPHSDTSVIYNAALAAARAEIYDKAVKYFEQTAKLNYGGSGLYLSWANAYRGSGDTAKALDIIQKGIKKFPDDNQHLITDLINHYLIAGDVDKAMNYLDMAIEKEPDNQSYHFAKGTLYEKLETQHNDAAKEAVQNKKDTQKEIKKLEKKVYSTRSKTERAKIKEEIEKLKQSIQGYDETAKKENAEAEKNIDAAIVCYEKAMELKPDYFEANYNMGVMYIKKANETLEAANNIPPAEDKDGSKFKAKKAVADKTFKKALPFLEKAYEVDPADEGLKQALSEIYVKLRMYDKAKAIKGE